MQKKFLIISFLLFIILFISSMTFCYAIDIDTNSLTSNYNNTNSSSSTTNTTNTTNTTRQNTTYTNTASNQSTTNTTSYTSTTSGQNISSSLPEAELGLPNILNIILIVVGILLILLGIAILIRIK